MGRLKEASKTDNLEEIRSATDALNQSWNEVSSDLYQQAGAQGQDTGQATGQDSPKDSQGGKDESVEEADYEVVDDDNKEEK